MKRPVRVLILLACAVGPALALAEEGLTISVKRLTLETALKIAQGAMDACRSKGIQISVAVVDRDGALQVKLRDTIAAPITLEISERKAFTAVNFNAPTSGLLSRSDSALGRLDSIILLAGGVPIEVGGSLLGGVGVSGAPTGDTDEACALAGVNRVMEDLQLAM